MSENGIYVGLDEILRVLKGDDRSDVYGSGDGDTVSIEGVNRKNLPPCKRVKKSP